MKSGSLNTPVEKNGGKGSHTTNHIRDLKISSDIGEAVLGGGVYIERGSIGGGGLYIIHPMRSIYSCK